MVRRTLILPILTSDPYKVEWIKYFAVNYIHIILPYQSTRDVSNIYTTLRKTTIHTLTGDGWDDMDACLRSLYDAEVSHMDLEQIDVIMNLTTPPFAALAYQYAMRYPKFDLYTVLPTTTQQWKRWLAPDDPHLPILLTIRKHQPIPNVKTLTSLLRAENDIPQRIQIARLLDTLEKRGLIRLIQHGREVEIRENMETYYAQNTRYDTNPC